MAYSKGALLFDYLEAYLGQETVDRAIRNYYDEYRFRHPDPENLEQAFTKHTEKDLSPFFDDFLHTTGKIDMKLKKVGKVEEFRYGDRYKVMIENKGDIAAPVPLTVIRADSTKVEEQWVEGVEKVKVVQPPYHTGQVKEFATDGQERIPDINRRNDRYQGKGLFPKQGPLSINPLIGIDDGDKNELYLFPTLGANTNDGFMAGIGIHEQGVMAEPFSFALAPMYGFQSGTVTGLGAIGWNGYWDGSRVLDHMRISLHMKRFSERNYFGKTFPYTRIAPRMDLYYEKADPTSPHRHRTRIEAPFIAASSVENSLLEQMKHPSSFISLQQFWQYQDPLTPMEAEVRGIHSEKRGVTRLGARWEGAFRYNDDQKEISLRLFGGKFLNAEHRIPSYNFRMDGRSPSNDFLYEHYFMGRGSRKGFWSQQFARREGGFFIPTAYGSSNDWIASAGLKLDLPFPERPALSFYFNQGWAPKGRSEYL